MISDFLCSGLSCHADTYDAVLDAEAQLVSEVRPANEDHGDGRTPDDVHLDPGLRLQTLRGHGSAHETTNSRHAETAESTPEDGSDLDDALAGAERQTHQTRPVYGHDLVTDVQPARLLRRPSMHHAGDDDGGEDGPPA